MGESKVFVQISIEEYDQLIANKKSLDDLLKSDRCIEVSSLYSYDIGGAVYLFNPTSDVKEIIDRLVTEKNQAVKTYLHWAGKDKNKRVKLWHVGKTIEQVINNK